jgi:hypothetical protein
MNVTTRYQASLPDLPGVLFWDIPKQTPDYKNHPAWVIKRVFERGSMEDIAEILLFYGNEKVKTVLTAAPHLDEDILFLASAILNTPLNDFLCYPTRQYRKIF